MHLYRSRKCHRRPWHRSRPATATTTRRTPPNRPCTGIRWNNPMHQNSLPSLRRRAPAATRAAAKPHAPIRRRCATACQPLRQGNTPCTVRQVAPRQGAMPCLFRAEPCGTRPSKKFGTTDAHRCTRMGRSPAGSFTAGSLQPNPGSRADAVGTVPSVCICVHPWFQISCLLPRVPHATARVRSAARKPEAHAPDPSARPGARGFKRRQNPMHQFAPAPQPAIERCRPSRCRRTAPARAGRPASPPSTQPQTRRARLAEPHTPIRGRRPGPGSATAASGGSPGKTPCTRPSRQARTPQRASSAASSGKTPCTCTAPTPASLHPARSVSWAAKRDARETRLVPQCTARRPSPHPHRGPAGAHATRHRLMHHATRRPRDASAPAGTAPGDNTPCPATPIPATPKKHRPPTRLRMTPAPGPSICCADAPRPWHGLIA